MGGGSIVKPEEIYSWLNFAEICQFANLAIFFAKASSRTITSESKKIKRFFCFHIILCCSPAEILLRVDGTIFV